MKAATNKKPIKDYLNDCIAEQINLFDWKLGIRGNKDDEYFVKLQKHAGEMMGSEDEYIKILYLHMLQNLHKCIEKSGGVSYKSIYDIVTRW